MTRSAQTTHVNPRDHLARRAAEKLGLISFAGGLPDPALFPKRQLSQAFVAALQSDAAGALQYGWPEGLLELRQQIASQLAERGADIAPESIITITSGQQFRAVPSQSFAIRLCFSAVPETDIEPGVARLARALKVFNRKKRRSR